MKICIDESVKTKFPNWQSVNSDDIVLTVSLADKHNSGFIFPLNFPLHDLDSIPWSVINDIGLAGKADTFFELGATKTDHMKNGFEAVYQIIGFNHDDLADGSGKAPISWDLVTLYKDEIYMKKDGKSSNWETSDGRSYLNEDFFNNMSDELRSIVKPVIKCSANADGKIVKTVDRVWLKSEKELFGRCSYSSKGEGSWYAFYRLEDVPYFKYNVKGEKDWQWLRSVRASNATGFCRVGSGGSAAVNFSGSSYGVAPGFCS